jgi:methionine synthase I (cobalamin-dependent)
MKFLIYCLLKVEQIVLHRKRLIFTIIAFIGGCCGVTPADIQKIRNAIEGRTR